MGAKNFSRRRIDPPKVSGRETAAQLIDATFTAYNAARLREACQLLTREIHQPGVTVGVSLSGALTPAGFGKSCLVPLIEHGLIDWICSTGANLYHDIHHAIGLEMHQGSPFADDVALHEEGVVRIYDIVFDFEVLLETDLLLRKLLRLPEFQRSMSTAECHYRLGRYVAGIEDRIGRTGSSLIAAAYRHAVPIFTSSPGDSSIGLNAAEVALEGLDFAFDVSLDVNLSSAIVWDAKADGGKSACVILGGGSPKNFLLQTEPQIQEVLGLEEAGHDFYVQVTDARPDTGGLSGATPSEAVSWGKVDPEKLPAAVVCYADSTLALPLLTHYLLANSEPRTPKRLYDRSEELMSRLRAAFRGKGVRESEGVFDESPDS